MPITGTAGIALGAVFGFIFVFTCIISVIKAVRDRKKIKRKIAERERQIAENSVKNGKCISSIEETVIAETSLSLSCKIKDQTNGNFTAASLQSLEAERLELDDRNSIVGVDNLTYAHSNSDIKQTSAICEQSVKSKCSVEHPASKPNGAHAPSKRTNSNDVIERRGNRNLRNLPQECLAVQKLLRRRSYEMAVCEHSWLPVDPPTFQTSNKIIHTYNYGRPGVTVSTTGFENKAFDTDDHKKT